jgi:hypothetical protein
MTFSHKGDTMFNLTEKFNSLKEKALDTLEVVKDKASDYAEVALDKVSDLTDSAVEMSRDAKEAALDKYEEANNLVRKGASTVSEKAKKVVDVIKE